MILKTEFDFDSAHRLVGYTGKCNQLHGHIWKVELEIEGTKKDLDEVGILWDFTLAKQLKNQFDHKTILKTCEENVGLATAIERACGKNAMYLMSENPTAEHLCAEILCTLKKSRPKLKYLVRVFESAKSSCEVKG